jgi:hypothetical protein
MSLRIVRRLLISSVAALSCAVGFMAPAAHADTLPGNTPSTPFPAAVYSNGCSFPGLNYLLDTQVFVDPNPWAFPYVFPVNFRPACDMHDAGYSGGIVVDPVLVFIADTRGMSRSSVDSLFLTDLNTICNRSIPAYAPVARTSCYGMAFTYYSAVRAAGWWSYDANPAVTGTQFTGTRPND